jgi:hypothetical protein
MIERFWRFMKSKVLDNRYFAQFVDFCRAFNEFFDKIGKWKSELESLLTPKFYFPGAATQNGIP